ncbi:DUF2523 domain-containing protein [Cupriavidus plantarum]|uniref:DUF2523 domain-containing protein n=1 Tax=Cupriavidus plantarum TaxID=942865 RepID=UPI0015CEBC8A|nr:DUF2523 domain-containing protein [Cupriavidus plantarum]NYI00234.1 hypothetical protein [Cupriavidus plantarum]
MPFVTILASAIIGLLAQAATALVGRVLLALGIGFVSFVGVDALMTGFRTLFLNYVSQSSALPWNIVGVLGVLKVGTCFNMILTTLAVRASLAGLTGGSVRKMVQK